MTFIVTSEFEIGQVASPNLPLAPTDYDSRYQEQLNNVLRLYFNRLDAILEQLKIGSGSIDGSGVQFPYGAFQDSTDQTAASTTVAYPVTFNTTDFSNGVTMVSGSRITVATAGLWNLQFSIQLTNNTNATQDVDIWFRVNGTNVTASNSRFGLAPRKSAGDPYHVIAALNYFISLNATDYIEIMWRTTNTGVSLEHYPVSASPTRPAVPSAIVTMSFVSALP
jgi:hypothetical protein